MSKINIKKGSNIVPVESIYNQNGGGLLKFWVGTIEEYNSTVSTPANDTVYIIKQN